MYSVVPNLVSKGKVRALTRIRTRANSALTTGESSKAVEAVAGLPYGDIQEIRGATSVLKDKDVNVIVMDCIGYKVDVEKWSGI